MSDEDKKPKGTLHKNNVLNELTGSEWIQLTKSWFVLNPRQRSDKEFMHPAKFPEELVERYVSFFTKSGQVVFDPFLGIGSTIIACAKLGRKGIGIEFSAKYAALAEKRLEKHAGFLFDKESPASDGHIIINGNSSHMLDIWQEPERKLPEKVDFIITSPPYWNMLGESRGNVISPHQKREIKGLDTTYSDCEGDLGNIQTYQEFLDSLCNIFGQCHEILKPKGHMVVVLQNLRMRNGQMCTLAWDVVNELRKNYSFIGEQLWLQDNKPLGIWGYPSVFVSNIHHHYCLIFQRSSVKSE